MDPLQVYQTYHSLWKIEESFRITKSYLDARPIYAHKKETIYGHFLICYLSLFLLRVLEIKVFKNEINSYDLIHFTRDFRVVKNGKRFLYQHIQKPGCQRKSQKADRIDYSGRAVFVRKGSRKSLQKLYAARPLSTRFLGKRRKSGIITAQILTKKYHWVRFRTTRASLFMPYVPSEPYFLTERQQILPNGHWSFLYFFV